MADLDAMTAAAEQGLIEIAGLINHREYNLSLVRSRQFMEQLVKSYAESNGVSYTDLADGVEKLYSAGVISRSSRDAFHNIRLFGNSAVSEGNDSAQDAQNAYYLLKEQIETFLQAQSRPKQSADRTPVSIDKSMYSRRNYADDSDDDGEVDTMSSRSGRTSSGRNRSTSDGRSASGSSSQSRQSRNVERTQKRSVPTREDRLRQQRNARRSGGKSGGIDIYAVLRILIPIICVIIIIVLIRGIFFPKKSSKAETTTAIETTAAENVEPTEPETQIPIAVPETTAAPEPAAVSYRVSGSKVNVRYFENQNRIYTQLAQGTEIGTVEEIQGSDFVKFKLDGLDVVISKQFIEPVS